MRVTAIVAHPDDEVLGIGGTLARHVKDGDEVRVVVVCTNSFRTQEVDSHAQLTASMKALGVQSFACLEFDDQKLDQGPFDLLVGTIREEVGDLAGLVYTHWCKDLNRDHRVVNEAVQLLTRPKTGLPLEVREFPTPSSTEYSREVFRPNTWIDISETLEQKIAALECYPLELQPEHLFRNARALRELAATLGRQVGMQAAEVVEIVRRLI